MLTSIPRLPVATSNQLGRPQRAITREWASGFFPTMLSERRPTPMRLCCHFVRARTRLRQTMASGIGRHSNDEHPSSPASENHKRDSVYNVVHEA